MGQSEEIKQKWKGPKRGAKMKHIFLKEETFGLLNS